MINYTVCNKHFTHTHNLKLIYLCKHNTLKLVAPFMCDYFFCVKIIFSLNGSLIKLFELKCISNRL